MPVLAIVIVIFFVVFKNVVGAAAPKAAHSARQQAARPVQKPVVKKVSPEAGHLCDDEQNHRMTFGASGDDLTAEVAEMNRRNNTIKARGPMRLRTMTAEDLAAKRRELKSRMDSGIIDAEEYRSIMSDYEKARIF